MPKSVRTISEAVQYLRQVLNPKKEAPIAIALDRELAIERDGFIRPLGAARYHQKAREQFRVAQSDPGLG